jgi:hypothetical protein
MLFLRHLFSLIATWYYKLRMVDRCSWWLTYILWMIKEPDIFGGPVACPPSYNALPTIKALLFRAQKPLRRTCLVDADEHLKISLSVPSGLEGDAYYVFRLVDPPDSFAAYNAKTNSHLKTALQN